METKKPSERMRNLRKKRGWTLQKAGEQMQINFATIAKIETNKQRPTSDYIQRFCEVYEVSASYVMEGIEEKNGLEDEEKTILEYIRSNTDIKKMLLDAAGAKKKVINRITRAAIGESHTQAHT